MPYRLLKAFHKVQQRLVRELEKKFSGKDVVIVANRRILPPSSSGVSNARPRSRTLTAVHEAILTDLVYPTEIVGKRIRYRLDGSKVMKVGFQKGEGRGCRVEVETGTSCWERDPGEPQGGMGAWGSLVGWRVRNPPLDCSQHVGDPEGEQAAAGGLRGRSTSACRRVGQVVRPAWAHGLDSKAGWAAEQTRQLTSSA